MDLLEVKNSTEYRNSKRTPKMEKEHEKKRSLPELRSRPHWRTHDHGSYNIREGAVVPHLQSLLKICSSVFVLNLPSRLPGKCDHIEGPATGHYELLTTVLCRSWLTGEAD